LKIRAPISGRIVGFELNTIGSIVQAGETLLKIVPENSAYIVEVRVRPGDIDEVRLGGAARVRLSAYSFRSTPPIDGSVVHVSADSFFDQTSKEAYYLAKIAVSEAQLAELKNVEALPSMPVQVMIATGEQTVFTYLANPVFAGLETAMVEGE
jgi:epimerase transport system membrane fusion protein